MTRGDVRRIYVDANVLLAFVSDEPDRAVIIEEVLRRAQGKTLAVLTSTVSIAEVAYGAEEKTLQMLDTAVEARIDTLWAPGAPVTLIEASRTVLVAARKLIRTNLAGGHGRLTPLDAIHLATAQIEDVDEVATYETSKHGRWSDLTGLPVSEPTLPQAPLDFGPSPGN